MIYKIIFQILLVIVIIIILKYFNDILNDEYPAIIPIETFDAKIERTTRNQCGNICAKLLNCNGFSYDNTNQFCYISEKPLLGKPEANLYSGEYLTSFPLCNKQKQIEDPVIATKDDYKADATFRCNTVDPKLEQYFIYNDNEIQLNSLDDTKNILVDPFKMNQIDYPTSALKSYDIDDMKYILNDNTKLEHIMRELDDEYLGQYLYPHMCTSNISKKDCLSACVNDNNCAGTEWNPVYLNKLKNSQFEVNEGVCCPKRKISKAVPRTNDLKYGKFYAKIPIVKSDLNNKQNIVTIS